MTTPPNAFEEIWKDLFSSPVHLDSALSKRSKNVKSILAQVVPQILLRPSSLAEALGIGVAPGEPWTLSQEELIQWRAGPLMGERLKELLVKGGVAVTAGMDDFPPHMIEEWKKDWGSEVTQDLAQVLGAEPPLSLRATRRMGAQDFLAELKAEKHLPVASQVSELSPMGVRLAGYTPVLQTKLYDQGAFEIQDEGSQVMSFFALWPEIFAGLLQDQPGSKMRKEKAPALPASTDAWTVVDACAGAGGKSLAMGDALGGKGRLYSYDISARKLQALSRRTTRAGLTNTQGVTVTENNESETVKKFARRAQAVLVDAPCTGWGVLRRNPDIKWRQDREVLTKMPKIQLRLLLEYSGLVAPGGRLTYGVCTFRKSETLEVVEAFLAENKDFERGPGGFLGPGPCDGFFMQSFTRRKK